MRIRRHGERKAAGENMNDPAVVLASLLGEANMQNFGANYFRHLMDV